MGMWMLIENCLIFVSNKILKDKQYHLLKVTKIVSYILRPMLRILVTMYGNLGDQKRK